MSSRMRATCWIRRTRDDEIAIVRGSITVARHRALDATSVALWRRITWFPVDDAVASSASTGSYMARSIRWPVPPRIPGVERGEDTDDALPRRERVTERERREHRRSVRFADHRRCASERLGHRAVPRETTERTVAAVTAHLHRHGRVVARRRSGPRCTASVRGPLRLIGDDDVGSLDESDHHGAAVGRREIEDHRALVAADVGPSEGVVAAHRAHAPHRVAGGRLDLDDVGAEIAEDRADERCGVERRELQHPDAVERAERVGHPRGAPCTSRSRCRSSSATSLRAGCRGPRRRPARSAPAVR